MTRVFDSSQRHRIYIGQNLIMSRISWVHIVSVGVLVLLVLILIRVRLAAGTEVIDVIVPLR
jgi:hypothetical protein